MKEWDGKEGEEYNIECKGCLDWKGGGGEGGRSIGSIKQCEFK